MLYCVLLSLHNNPRIIFLSVDFWVMKLNLPSFRNSFAQSIVYLCVEHIVFDLCTAPVQDNILKHHSMV